MVGTTAWPPWAARRAGLEREFGPTAGGPTLHRAVTVGTAV